MTAPGPYSPPAPAVALIGRTGELAALGGLLLDEATRLVTLLGPPGVGKTLLAMHAARALAGQFADGAAFVPLDTIRDPALVPAAVARTLGLREQGGESPAESILRALAPARLLLVLDNVEQVIEAAAFVAELLARCPDITLLATSRTPLHLRAELRQPVEPLAIATIGKSGPAAPLSGGSRMPAATVEGDVLLAGAASPAVELFARRARAVRPDFALTAENTADVVAICTALDGLPLAIELAAARVALLSPAEIAQRLVERLALLVGGYRDLPERHRSLRAAIAWSYDLLSPDEQRIFRLFGGFAGGTTPESVEAVAAALAPDAAAPPALDLVLGLANQSLVRRVEASDGVSRYHMLATIREYALERLVTDGEAEAVRLRIGVWYAALVEQAGTRLHGPEQAAWLRRLDAEHDNLRAVLAWTLERGESRLGLELAAVLGRFWRVRGHISEGRLWLDRLLARAEGTPSRTRAAALDAAAFLAHLGGDKEAHRRFAEQALALYQDAGDERGLAVALHRLGVMWADTAAYDEAAVHLEESLALARRLGDAALIRPPLYNLGQIELSSGRAAAARARFEEALDLAKAAEDAAGVASARTALAFAARQAGEYAAARADYTEALRLRRELGDRIGIANALRLLADLETAAGALDAARTYAEEALAIAQETGHAWGIVSAYDALTAVARKQGDLAAAWRFARLDVRAASDLDDPQRILAALGEWAAVAAVAGADQAAIRAYAAAEAGREALGFSFGADYEAEMDGLMSALRDRLGDRAFSELWSAGASRSVAQAVEDALAAETEPATAEPAAPGGPDRLTPRETEVLRLLAAGLSNREIAERLVVSRRTVDHHLTALYAKIGARGRVDATAYAIEHGLGQT